MKMKKSTRWAMVLGAGLLISACGPAGIEGRLVNPCSSVVEFHWDMVPEGAAEGRPPITTRVVPPHGVAYVAQAGFTDDWEIVVVAPALGYEERWKSPGLEAERTFEPDASLCP